MHVKSVPYIGQATQLTETMLQRRVLGTPRDHHGGQSTSDNATTSAASPLHFPRSATTAAVIIIDFVSFINSLNLTKDIGVRG